MSYWLVFYLAKNILQLILGHDNKGRISRNEINFLISFRGKITNPEIIISRFDENLDRKSF